METARDVYDFAEKFGQITGRDAVSLIKWAARQVGSTQPAKVGAQLRQAQRAWARGLVPDGFPAAVPLCAPVRFFNNSEEENWQ